MELVIGESVKETNRVFVKSYTEEYCKAITENYREYHIRTLKGNLHGNYPEYARQQLDEIENGTANLMKFEIREGKKYYKIVQFIHLLTKIQGMFTNLHHGKHHIQNTLDLLSKNQRIFDFYLHL